MKRAGAAGVALAMSNDSDALVAGYAAAKGAQAIKGIKNMFGSSSSSVGSNGASGSPSRSGGMEGQPLSERTFLQFESKLFSYMNALVGFSDKELQLVRNQDLRNRERLAEAQARGGVPKRGDKKKKGFGDWASLLGLGGLGALLGLAGLDKLQKMGAVDLDEVSDNLKKMATAILGVRVAQQTGKVVRTVSRIAADALKKVNEARAKAKGNLKAEAEKELKSRASKIRAQLEAEEKRIRAKGRARLAQLDTDIKNKTQRITSDFDAKNKALDARRAKLNSSMADFDKRVAALELERTKARNVSTEQIKKVTNQIEADRNVTRSQMQAEIAQNKATAEKALRRSTANLKGLSTSNEAIRAAQAAADANAKARASDAARAAAKSKAPKPPIKLGAGGAMDGVLPADSTGRITLDPSLKTPIKAPPPKPRLVPGGAGGALPVADANRIALDPELNKIPAGAPKLVSGGALDDFLDKNAASRFAGTYDELGRLLGVDKKPTTFKKGDPGAAKAQTEIKQIAAKNQAALRASGALSGIPEEQLKAGFDAEGRAPKPTVKPKINVPKMGDPTDVGGDVRLRADDINRSGLTPEAKAKINKAAQVQQAPGQGRPTRSVNPPSKLTAEQLETIKRRIASAKRVIGKSIPFIGAALAFYDMFERAARGDLIGVTSAGAAGIASFLPIIGIPAVLADVAFQIYRDSYRDLFGVGPLQDTSPKAVKQARDKLLMAEIIKGLISPESLSAAKELLAMVKRGEFKGGSQQKIATINKLRSTFLRMGLTREEVEQLLFEAKLEYVDMKIMERQYEGESTSGFENQRSTILQVLSNLRAKTGRASADILGGAAETNKRLTEERRKTVRNLLGVELSDAEADQAVAAREIKGGKSFLENLIGKTPADIVKRIQDYVNPQSGTLMNRSKNVVETDGGLGERQNKERINAAKAAAAKKEAARLAESSNNPDPSFNKANNVNIGAEATQ